MVGGTCPPVGLAGGYTQGRGHSMLSTAYGLGADQVLEWEAVLGMDRTSWLPRLRIRTCTGLSVEVEAGHMQWFSP